MCTGALPSCGNNDNNSFTNKLVELFVINTIAATGFNNSTTTGSVIIFVQKMKELIILEGITKEELFQRIQTAVDNAVSARLLGFIDEVSKVKRVKYITRKETASHLKISLPTLQEWTKLGILKSIKIGNRVLYRSDIVETYNEDLQKGMRKKHHRY